MVCPLGLSHDRSIHSLLRRSLQSGVPSGTPARLIQALLCGTLLGQAAPLLALEAPATAPPPLPPALTAAPAALPQLTPAAAPTPAPTAATGATPGSQSLAATTSTASLSSTRQIVLELGRRTISLVEGDKVLGRWPVAIGDPATPTPTGSFQVRNKVVNPQYQSTRTGKNNPTTGPNGPLGDRWIGFHTSGINQFGIHGTPPAWEWTVKERQAVSHGCVRMLTPHVRALFDQVEVGTPVLVKR